MIEIASIHIENKIILSPDTVNVLAVESPKQFYAFVSQLYEQCDGGEGEFVFVDGDKQISADKIADMIVNPIALDFNGKKNLNCLYKKLEKVFNDGEGIIKLNKINSLAADLLYDLFSDVNVSLDFSDMSITEFIKAHSVRISQSYDGFLEKIICYINVLISVDGYKAVIFVNLKSYLSDEQLILLYDHCEKEKISLLLIESNVARPILDREKAVIITEDLCELLVNY